MTPLVIFLGSCTSCVSWRKHNLEVNTAYNDGFWDGHSEGVKQEKKRIISIISNMITNAKSAKK